MSEHSMTVVIGKKQLLEEFKEKNFLPRCRPSFILGGVTSSSIERVEDFFALRAEVDEDIACLIIQENIMFRADVVKEISLTYPDEKFFYLAATSCDDFLYSGLLKNGSVSRFTINELPFELPKRLASEKVFASNLAWGIRSPLDEELANKVFTHDNDESPSPNIKSGPRILEGYWAMQYGSN